MTEATNNTSRVVGEAGTMPGTTGFTIAVFRAEDVPVGAKLYTAPPDGEVVVTKSEAGHILAVTRQNQEGRVLSVIAESAPPAAAVVMPERKTKTDFSGYIESFQTEAAAIYNSALDEVARLNPAPVEQSAMVVPEGWLPMDTAPKDGTLLRLMVEFDDHPTEDTDGPAPTIGANNFDNDGEDRWQFAGWCWSHDHFTEGKGKQVGWLPMLADAPAQTEQHPVGVVLKVPGEDWNSVDFRIDLQSLPVGTKLYAAHIAPEQPAKEQDHE